MPAVAPTSPLIANFLPSQLFKPLSLEMSSQLRCHNSLPTGASKTVKQKPRGFVSQMHPRPHLTERGPQARSIQSKAAYQTDAQQTSSSVTGTKGSNGWAWVLGGLTLTTGTSAPALYIGAHWNEVAFYADCFTRCGFGIVS